MTLIVINSAGPEHACQPQTFARPVEAALTRRPPDEADAHREVQAGILRVVLPVRQVLFDLLVKQLATALDFGVEVAEPADWSARRGPLSP